MIEARNLIKSKGLKATPQRIAVYKSLKELGHASADMVIENVMEIFPTMTVATVYNILESFVNVGLIERLSSSNVKMYFDVNTFAHCHLYSTHTNTYQDFNDGKLTNIIRDYLADKTIDGFNMTGVEVHILGEFTNNTINQ